VRDELLLWLLQSLILYGLVLGIAILENLWDILCLLLDGLVINNLVLAWNVLKVLHWLVLEIRLLVWDVFNTVFTLLIIFKI
jgi:hypothetical protein